MRLALVALAAGLLLPGGLSAQQRRPMSVTEGIAAPPTAIPGVEARPEAPLEFGRAWLRKMSAVRRRRAELRSGGRLDGMTPAALADSGAALAGTLRVPIIPVVYEDVAPPFPIQSLANRLFGPGTADTVSYAGYWREVSSGLLEVTGDVAPWVRMPHDAKHYLDPARYGWARFGRVREFRARAVAAADETLDFGRYDNDGPDGIPNSGDDDGYVDFVAFLYAVSCPDDRRAGAIWPHRGAMEPFETNDRAAGGGWIRVADYVIHPVLDTERCEPLQAGVLAHETGHAFGLPDLYDYDGSSRGIGGWGLMGTGAHNAPYSPAHPSAWVKEQLGWARVEWVREDRAGLSVPPIEREPVVYRYDIPGARGRYLLLENRQRIGSDAKLPGTGLLVWRVDPERGELRAWNGDERRAAVTLLEADGRADLLGGRAADDGDPFPGSTRRADFVLEAPGAFRLDGIRDDDGVLTADLALGRDGPTLVAPHAVALAAVPGERRARRVVEVRLAGADDDFAWSVRSSTSWLRGTAVGDSLYIDADPDGLRPGDHRARLEMVDDESGRVVGRTDVRLEIATPGVPTTVASRVPWSWGLAARRDDVIQASYGWDPSGLRRRPGLFRVDAARPHPTRLARLPADALYSPVARDDGTVYVLAEARRETYLYRVSPDGKRAEVVARLGGAPAYGLARLPDGDLLVAHWDGRIRKVSEDGGIEPWTRLDSRIYQIAADAGGTVYAAAYDGDVIRIVPGARPHRIATGFGSARLTTITAAPDGGAFAAERGGAGRILRIGRDGKARALTRARGAAFYGLAVAGRFLYALDLENRRLLRIPITVTAPRTVAGR